ncbi:MAG: YhcH/YjgK/YiaL family protein [Candidatus Hydrogenedentes bacterium]|nr:YhcH/YjgK/YiaL family protein [Candidatus Hydrogenedentota bacterium]
MILDTLPNWGRYPWQNDRFRAGFQHLLTLDAAAPDGKHSIAGDDVFCNVMTYETSPAEGHEFETHRDYADIQCVLAGREAIRWAPRQGLTVTKPYEPDAELQALVLPSTELIMTPGRFAVFFPDDAHAPGIACEIPATVRKAVVKVRL